MASPDQIGSAESDSQREKELRQILNLTPQMITVLEPDGRISWQNNVALDYLGISLADVNADDFRAQIVHPDDLQSNAEYRRRAFAEGLPFEAEQRVRGKDGKYRWFLNRYKPLRDAEGRVVRWYSAATDIEDLKRAEEAARRSEKELRDIVETMPAMAWSALPDGSNAFVTRQWGEYTGLSGEQSLGTGWQSTVHPEDFSGHMEEWHRSLATGLPFEHETRLRRAADGQYRWFLVRAVPLRDEHGSILKWYGIVTDIEDRKRAEEDLRRSEAYLAEAQKLTKTGSLAWEPDNAKTLHCSDEVFRMFGLDPQKGIPAIAELLERVHPEDREYVTGRSRKGADDKAGPVVDYRLLLDDGIVKYIHSIRHPVLSDSGEVVEFMGTLIDVTEQKRAEEALRRSEAYLAEAQRLTRTGSWAWDPRSDRMIHCSEELYRIFGLDSPDGAPSIELFLQRIHPEDRDRVTAEKIKGTREKADNAVENRLLLPDGTIKYVLTKRHAVFDGAGELVEMIGTVVDVTEQVQSRQALEKAFEEIEVLKDQLYKENLALRDEIDRASMFEEIVGTSLPLQAALARVAKVGPTDSTVLITGETGTGKELIARAIHKRSRRSGRAFVSVNCAALAPSLISSELFGHEKGAFTGATQRRLGRFELADGGTIFLDEVGELPPETQVALLRVLQEREFERVGGNQPVHVDVRVIAATNRDLKAATASGAFRQDLFYRLNVFPIDVPPLRERRDDILVLVEYFVQHYARGAGKRIQSIDKQTLELFQSYDWPGNIRELQNVIERSVILTSGAVLSVDKSWLSTESSQPSSRVQAPHSSVKDDRGEREIIEAALAESRGRVAGPQGAAAKLRVGRSTLERRIKALKIRKSQFKFG